MVFLIQQINRFKSPTIIWVTAIILSAGFCYAGAGPLYPDIECRIVSDNHLIINFTPRLSDDFLNLTGATLYSVEGKDVWGRTFLVAVPDGGDLTYSLNFRQLGSVEEPMIDNFISSQRPLILTEDPITIRNHRFVRIVLFPQRLENGRLVAYTDFVVDVSLTGGTQSAVHQASTNRIDSVLAGLAVNPKQFFSFAVSPNLPQYAKVTADVIDLADYWGKISIENSGVHRISGSDLSAAGFDLINLPSDSIMLFYAGGVDPAYDPLDQSQALFQVPIMIVDGGDGIFDPSDHLLFYGEAVSRYDFESGQAVYQKNSYNDLNCYWLATSGLGGGNVPLRWQTSDGTPPVSSPTALDFRNTVRIEQDNIIKIDGDGRTRNYYRWYWTLQEKVTSAANLHHPTAGDSLDLVLDAIINFSQTKVSINGTSLAKYSLNGTYHYYGPSDILVDGLNSVLVEMARGTSDHYLDYLELNYPAAIRYDGDQLEFNSQGYVGVTQYQIEGFGLTHTLLNITNPDNPTIVGGVAISGSNGRFEQDAISQPLSRYLAYTASDIFIPVSIERIESGSLQSDLSQQDCIVISPRRWHNALGEYVDYRLAQNGRRVKLVAVEDIYDRFGYGLKSPLAIRNYLQYAYQNYSSPAPYTVILAGDGHYDYLDNLGLSAPSYVPPFMWGREHSGGDDNFVYFGPLDSLDSDGSFDGQGDRGWDMMVCRWPVRSSSDVAAYIGKLKSYESAATQGAWRSRITFVADDEFKSQSAGEIIHTAQTETLSVFHTPRAFVQEKIYATDYPFASNGEKPSANDAIVRAINNGTLLINYIGHGSPDLWADERIFKKSSDLGRLNNYDKLVTVIAGSCSIGKFDDVGREGMAELMFRQDGGAITTVSATRLVYASSNAIFVYDLYDALFGGYYNIPEATYVVKLLHQMQRLISVIRNDRSYVIFGDPLSRLGLPQYEVKFSKGGDSVLTPLEYFGFSGAILDMNGDSLNVSGSLDVTVYDSRFMRHHELGIDYSLGGPPIFRGPVTVAGGHFTGGFIVPLDIDYGGDDARLSGFGIFGSVSGLGGLDSLKISTTAGISSDNSGPSIAYSFDENPEFQSGDRIVTNATLVLDLSDSSGINLTGGVGHRIELIFDNDNNSTINLTDLFAYEQGSYQAGQVRFTLPDMTPGVHSYKIKVWDNANNPSIAEFEATAAETGRISIANLMNYPNPMEEQTEFFFDLSESAEFVEIQVFTLAGRLLKRYHSGRLMAGPNRLFVWDGRDLDGDRVAEGVYLYKIIVRGGLSSAGQSSDNMAEAFGKLILLN